MNHSLLHYAATTLLGMTCLTANAQSATCAVDVHVNRFHNQKGKLAVTVFNSPDGWPEDSGKSVFHQSYEIDGDQATAHFNLPTGRYAIAVLHDENENHKLDRNFMGVPKEGFGFSNNPKVGLSAPGFETAAFQIACPATKTSIHLNYK